MRIVVTGRHGQLATSLAERALLHPGVELVTLGRPLLDLETPGSARAAIVAAGPDLVVNAAAFTAVDDAEDEVERAMRINGEAAGEVAAAARDQGAPIVHISTDYVFDGSGQGPYGEDAPTAPLGAYGRSKLAGEAAVREAAPDHLILRTAWVYSPFGRNFLKTMMKAAGERPSLRVVADQKGSPTSALDLADAILAIASAWRRDPRPGLGRTFHAVGSGTATWYDFAVFIMESCARLGLSSVPVEPVATADWPTRALRPANSVLGGSGLRDTFGLALPDWRSSAAATIERLAAEGRAA